METNNYRDILKEKLIERCRKNRGYSLRAFARDLGITPAQLSRVLSGKRHLSSDSARVVASEIYKTASDRKHFTALVTLASSKNKKARTMALETLAEKNSLVGPKDALFLETEKFKLLTDWYHLAILDLTTIKEFKSDALWIANYLGISQTEVKDAIQRLISLGLLQAKNKTLIKAKKRLDVLSNVPSEAIRSFHKQMIAKAIVAIDQQKLEERYFSSKTMTISKKNLDKLKLATDEYMENIASIVSQDSGVDSLYQLNIQLFDLKSRREK